MRAHNGMRPQDIVVLLKIIAKGETPWQFKDLANELFLSPAEVSMSLHRSAIAGLINSEKRNVHRMTLLEFIQYGLPVVFPGIRGGVVNGLLTAHSHPFMQEYFASNSPYVWPDVMGKNRGESIEPLYKDVVKAAMLDEELYKMLALLDVIRIGKVREKRVALDELKASLGHKL